MTSRERILAAIAHKEPDRVPIDLGGMRSSGIMAIAHNNLKRHLGAGGPETRLVDFRQQLAEPEPEIIERFHLDAVDLHNSLGNEPDGFRPWPLPDGSPGMISTDIELFRAEEAWELRNSEGAAWARMPDGCLYFDRVPAPFVDLNTSADADAVYVSPLLSREYIDDVRERAKWLYENTELAVLLHCGGSIFSGLPLNTEQFLMELALGNPAVEYMLDRLVEDHLANLGALIAAAGEYAQIIVMADDLGAQNGLMISPDLYRRVIKPRHARIYRYVRENSDLHLFLHCCGSCSELIGDLIDIGVEILNPVQTSAAKMDPRELKREFGGEVTFWGGGCDTQSVLTNATPEEIDRHVRERIDILAPGGGFVFSQVHNIQANVPPENIVAMLDAAYSHAGGGGRV